MAHLAPYNSRLAGNQPPLIRRIHKNQFCGRGVVFGASWIHPYFLAESSRKPLLHCCGGFIPCETNLSTTASADLTDQGEVTMDRNAYKNVGLIVATFILVFGGGTASAQHAAKAQSDNAQIASVDANGKVRKPTPEELQKITEDTNKNLSHSTQGLVVVKRVDGSRFVDLQDRFQSVSLAKVGADGKVQTECVNSKEEAKKFLETDTRSAAKP